VYYEQYAKEKAELENVKGNKVLKPSAPKDYSDEKLMGMLNTVRAK